MFVPDFAEILLGVLEYCALLGGKNMFFKGPSYS